MAIKYPPSINAIQKTLDSQLLAGVTASMTLNNVTGIQNKPGVCVIDAVDANDNTTADKREYIVFTGVSGNTLTGLTRNADSGSSDQDHSVGAIVQFPPDVLQQQELIDQFLVQHADGGVHSDALVTSLKATGEEINIGTEDAKIVTPKAIADSKVSITDKVETLANKTLTTPVIASIYQDAGKTKLMTLPNTASDTIVTLAATQTMTNKRLTSPKINEDVALTATATQLNAVGAGGVTTRLLSKILSGTRDATAASGNVSYTGVGFQPTSIIVQYCVNDTLYNGRGHADSARNNGCLYQHAANLYSATDLFIYHSDKASWSQEASVASYDADGFTLTWTKSGTVPSGTIAMRFICYR